VRKYNGIKVYLAGPESPWLRPMAVAYNGDGWALGHKVMVKGPEVSGFEGSWWEFYVAICSAGFLQDEGFGIN
jgi:hypothetical protein